MSWITAGNHSCSFLADICHMQINLRYNLLHLFPILCKPLRWLVLCGRHWCTDVPFMSASKNNENYWRQKAFARPSQLRTGAECTTTHRMTDHSTCVTRTLLKSGERLCLRLNTHDVASRRRRSRQQRLSVHCVHLAQWLVSSVKRDHKLWTAGTLASLHTVNTNQHTSLSLLSSHKHNRFAALFPPWPRWASARRTLLLDFTIQEEITEADTPTIQLGTTPSGLISDPPPSNANFYAGCPSCHNPPNLSWLGTGTKYAGLHTKWLGYFYLQIT